MTKKPRGYLEPGGVFDVYARGCSVRRLNFFVSAASRVGLRCRCSRGDSGVHVQRSIQRKDTYGHSSSRWQSYVRDVLYRGINIWDWETGERFMIDDDFSDKIRADWSRNGRLVAINQQGGSNPYFVYEVGEDGKRSDGSTESFEELRARGCDGIRGSWIVEGRYLGVVSLRPPKGHGGPIDREPLSM